MVKLPLIANGLTAVATAVPLIVKNPLIFKAVPPAVGNIVLVPLLLKIKL